ncbi:protein ALP1-like [Miscanthus floridulus]|uniref:protein ALP1-like n=1 Tax=Miscanthus floridulus TaxID=154761 RepID=UPI0034592D41
MPRKRSRARRQLDESSSDDDDLLIFSAAQIVSNFSNAKRRPGGSVPSHRVIYRDREGGHDRMFQDYLADNPTYGPDIFRRRYMMSRELFLRIMNAVEAHDDYFVQKRNAANVLGLSCFQKVTVAMRMLTYGVPADATDEYVRIGESTALESLRRFVAAVVDIFEDEYLRYPNEKDTACLLAMGERKGFPGMLGCIDCMHWAWKNCPYDKQGQYKGHVDKPTIILEAVALDDLWIWHAFFGMPGSHNDINVLHRSPLFANLAEGTAPQVNYTVNGHDYTMGYYLADGIYPSWATLVKSITLPMENKRQYFAKAQEAARKAVERAFGVLQSRFTIVRGPARIWDIETLALIMKACIIMHNMIIEDEGHVDPDERFDNGGENVEPEHGQTTRTLQEFIDAHKRIRDPETHVQLKEDLIEHLWNHHPDLYSF